MSTGAVAAEYSYDSFGARTTTGAEVQRYGFTGREHDSESGLIYFRARHYDPVAGLFIQRDPIGFAGGDLNLYAYVWNDPHNLTDPSGLVVASDAAGLHGSKRGADDSGAKEGAEDKPSTLGDPDPNCEPNDPNCDSPEEDEDECFGRLENQLDGMARSEFNNLFAKWGRGTFERLSDSLRHHAVKHWGGDLVGYLRAASNFSTKGAKRISVDEGATRYEKNGRFSICRNGKIVSFGRQ